MTDRARLLEAFRLSTDSAKSHIFNLQDLAGSLDDRELKRCLQEVRDWIEAADRRALDLTIDLPLPHRGDAS